MNCRCRVYAQNLLGTLSAFENVMLPMEILGFVLLSFLLDCIPRQSCCCPSQETKRKGNAFACKDAVDFGWPSRPHDAFAI